MRNGRGKTGLASKNKTCLGRLREKQRTAALVGALLFGSTFLSGCGDVVQKEKPLLVKTQQAASSTEAQTGSYSGTVRGRYETKVAFQVTGRILSRNVNVGSRVNAGDVLMVIDARDVQQQANAGDAQVSAARAQLSLAQANLARYTELYQAEAVSASVLDQYQTNYDAAFAAYQQALSQAAQAHNSLGYTNLTAGASGVVSSVEAEEGQVVAAGQTVLTLVQTNELEVEISVPESQIDSLRVGQEAQISFWALKETASGVVREISPMADSTSRTYTVRVTVTNPPKGMELGMTADVRLPQGEADGVLLPLSAIYQTEGTPEVWVVKEDSTVELRPVTVETFDENRVRVHGLALSDVVVTAGVHKLRAGQEVRTEAKS